MSRYVALIVLLFSSACKAVFVDYRDPLSLSDMNVGLTEMPIDEDASGPEVVLASGSFVGRAGHFGHGEARLVRSGSGTLQVRFGADFLVSEVQGPFVVLTPREDLGTALDPRAGDLVLGALQSSSRAQTYSVPGVDAGRRVVFVYCKPLGIEVAKAHLVDSQ